TPPVSVMINGVAALARDTGPDRIRFWLPPMIVAAAPEAFTVIALGTVRADVPSKVPPKRKNEPVPRAAPSPRLRVPEPREVVPEYVLLAAEMSTVPVPAAMAREPAPPSAPAKVVIAVLLTVKVKPLLRVRGP